MSAVFSPCRTWRYTLTRNVTDAAELTGLEDPDEEVNR